ncbi:MAG: ATP-grasp domain-containing protein, partial [Verrucomicrobiae bacterium]|nr:ATP-grasp domain-containing protein [Verrucomicrobiae bacterium]
LKEILFVGKRQPAIEAARALGCSFSVQDVESRSEQATGAFGGTVEASVAAAKKLYHNATPSAVLAVAEGAVPSAAAIREKFGLQGLDPESAQRCHNKLTMKKAVVAAGIPCAPWLETAADTTPEEVVERLGLPVVLKVPISSGGRGVSLCSSVEEVAAALAPGLLAEEFIAGAEMSVESFRKNNRTLFRNHTRYLVPHWASIVPASESLGDQAAINALAERVHEALGINDGMTHMEIFLTPEGPVFGEIAARPPGGRLMELIGRAYDFDPWRAVLQLSLGETPRFPDQARCFAGVWMLYPDAGVVTKISGLSEARKVPQVARLTCRAKPGREYPARLGTGQSAGEIIVVADTMNECESRLREAHDLIAFEIAPA